MYLLCVKIVQSTVRQCFTPPKDGKKLTAEDMEVFQVKDCCHVRRECIWGFYYSFTNYEFRKKRKPLTCCQVSCQRGEHHVCLFEIQ